MRIQEVIDRILAEIPGAPLADTVDTVKAGDPSQPMTGIVTTFLASCAVLEQTIDRGANFVITHEPTFYNHLDETGWLAQDAVFQAKRALIDRHRLVIWRFHDYWHRHRPDGIVTGVLRALGWEAYADMDRPYPHLVTLPAQPLAAVVAHLKAKLGAQTARVIGPPDMMVERVALAVGAPGGTRQIQALSGDLDALVTGEIHEWEVSEYARDALYQGQRKALIILGHAVSEEAGMAYLADWLRARLPDVDIAHIPTGDLFRFE